MSPGGDHVLGESSLERVAAKRPAGAGRERGVVGVSGTLGEPSPQDRDRLLGQRRDPLLSALAQAADVRSGAEVRHGRTADQALDELVSGSADVAADPMPDPRLARSTSKARDGPTPAFVLAGAFAAGGADAAAYPAAAVIIGVGHDEAATASRALHMRRDRGDRLRRGWLTRSGSSSAHPATRVCGAGLTGKRQRPTGDPAPISTGWPAVELYEFGETGA